jgi:hypothetical protein
MLAGKIDQAREAADEAGHLAERLHYPVGHAAATEALGATATDPAEGARMLDEAKEAWGRLGRPAEQARCDLLKGHLLRTSNPDGARVALDAAAAAFEELQVPHLVHQARELTPA